jgi:hypothetical protein
MKVKSASRYHAEFEMGQCKIRDVHATDDNDDIYFMQWTTILTSGHAATAARSALTRK